MKRLRYNAILILGLVAVANARAEDTIVVLKSRDQAQFNAAAESLARAWTSGPVRTLTLPQTGAVPATAVIAVGTEAAKWAIANTRGPVVFCMVANAQQNLIAGLSADDARRVRGVSLDIPAKTQLEQLKMYLPNARRIGVIFNPKKSRTAVTEAVVAAAELGLEIIEQAVTGELELPAATQALAARVDAIWAPVDSTVYSGRSAQFVLTQMLQKKIPVFGFSENMVKAGALLGPRLNYEAVGRQTAELLRAALRGEVNPETVQPPHEFDVVINARVLKLIDHPIPARVLQQASFINDD